MDGARPALCVLSLGVILSLTAAFLVIPVRGIARRIGVEKERELVRVRAAIRARRGAGDADPEATAERLAPLLAYEARIERVREWPFDGSTLLRLAAYLSIAVGSWLGGAVVERVVDLALD